MPDRLYQPPPVPFSLHVLLILLTVLLVSAVVFTWQVRRWTTNRRWLALWDWARMNGFRFSRREQSPPEGLKIIARDLRMTTCLDKGRVWIVQIEDQTDLGGPPRFHLLMRAIETDWKPAGLRPTNAAISFLDLFSMNSYPAMGEAGRFVVFAGDTPTARKISKTHSRGLLPPDVGMMLLGRNLILDFTSRPFDPIEFGRMTALAEQLVGNLPA